MINLMGMSDRMEVDPFSFCILLCGLRSLLVLRAGFIGPRLLCDEALIRGLQLALAHHCLTCRRHYVTGCTLTMVARSAKEQIVEMSRICSMFLPRLLRSCSVHTR